MQLIIINAMEKVNRSESQVILLIWKNRGENDVLKYEIFTRVTILFRKYQKELGVSLGTLNNYISHKGCDSVIYENNLVRIIRTKLNSLTDFPPSKEEKDANQEKAQRRKEKLAKQ